MGAAGEAEPRPALQTAALSPERGRTISGGGAVSIPIASPLEPSALGRRWGIYTPGELRQRRQTLDLGKALIQNLLPKRTLSIVVGDSGLGKSPLLYQAAICVAAGVPFLGCPVSQGRVLYLDFENGLGEVDDLVSCLSKHLGLTEVPADLYLFNYNDSPTGWSPESLANMIRDVKPAWVIIDSLSAFAPDIEEKSTNVTRTYQGFRKAMSDYGTAITVVHHVRKPSTKREEAPPLLEENPHGWFLQTRGSRALVNSCDVRLGVDRSGMAKKVEDLDGRCHDVALVLGGFGRVRGKIEPTFVARVLNEQGEPSGYEKLSGVSLLFDPDRESIYKRLPETFRFKEAQQIYGKGAQATIGFLKKCIAIGVMKKTDRGYRKVTVAERTE